MIGRRGRMAAFIALWLFASATLAAHFAWRGTLYGDTLVDYSFFYNNLQSIHRHGEPAWWYPNTQMGYPGYFFAVVSLPNAAMPAFGAVGAIAWLLGRVGLALPAFHGIYVFYFGALVPLLFLSGVWLVARELFRSAAVVAYVLVVAAFSPGVMMNLSDIGALEHTAYALFFTAALVRLLRMPSRRAFFRLAFTAGLLGLSLNYLFLVTAAPLLLVVAVMLLAHRAFRRRWQLVWRTQPAWRWALVPAVAALCALPNVIAFGQPGDLDRGGGLAYSFEQLKTGNPWEALLASSPAVGFEWDEYYDTDGRVNRYLPQGLFKATDHVSYGYLGLLGWPLAIWGLLGGRHRLRVGLLGGLVLFFAVMLLGGYSPLFASILVWPTPLRGMNHFSDMLYRDSGFLVLLLAAGLGLERAAWTSRRGLATVFVLVAVGSMTVTAKLHDWELGPATGLAVFLALLVLLVLAWQRRAVGRQRQWMLRLLVVLTLVDVSTAAFWYVRLVLMRHDSPVSDAPHADGLGIAHPRANWGSGMMRSRHLTRMIDEDLPLKWLPDVAVYGTAHVQGESPTRDDVARAAGREPERRSLAVVPDPGHRAELEAVFRSRGAVHGAHARLLEKTFNTARIETESGAPALLFVKDAFSPYWSARVNGTAAPVFRALGAFKAVPVPAGRSEVVLRFAPAGMAPSIAAAYAALTVLGVLALRSRDGRQSPDA